MSVATKGTILLTILQNICCFVRVREARGQLKEVCSYLTEHSRVLVIINQVKVTSTTLSKVSQAWVVTKQELA
ncbi:hypothetical protein D3C81_2144850 [compost metagenome]